MNTGQTSARIKPKGRKKRTRKRRAVTVPGAPGRQPTASLRFTPQPPPPLRGYENGQKSRCPYVSRPDLHQAAEEIGFGEYFSGHYGSKVVLLRLRTPCPAWPLRQAARSFGSPARVQAAMVIVNWARPLSRRR